MSCAATIILRRLAHGERSNFNLGAFVDHRHQIIDRPTGLEHRRTRARLRQLVRPSNACEGHVVGHVVLQFVITKHGLYVAILEFVQVSIISFRQILQGNALMSWAKKLMQTWPAIRRFQTVHVDEKAASRLIKEAKKYYNCEAKTRHQTCATTLPCNVEIEIELGNIKAADFFSKATISSSLMISYKEKKARMKRRSREEDDNGHHSSIHL